MSIALKIVLALLAGYITFRLQRRYHFVQYAYFLRAPLILASTFVVFPWLVMAGPLRDFGRNWFLIDAPGMFFVTFLALVAAWAVMYQLGFLYETTPLRSRLPFRRDSYDPLAPEREYRNEIPAALYRHRLVLASSLAWPTIGVSWWSAADEQALPAQTVALLAGVMAGYAAIRAMRALNARFEAWAAKSHGKLHRSIGARWQHLIVDPITRAAASVDLSGLTQGLEASAQRTLHFTFRRTLAFAVLTVTIYLALCIPLFPTRTGFPIEQFPGIAYLLLLLLVITFIVPSLTLVLDKYRVPVLLALVALPLLLTSRDYFFEVSSGRGDGSVTVESAQRAWATRVADPKRPMVVVAASGGGITAAYWTGVVLASLERETGGAFSKSVVLLSAVSGGSVGAMYFVDAYRNGNVGIEAAAQAAEHSGRSSLGAAAWGIVYPDLLRTLTGISLYRDRGWAQEQRWSQRLSRAELRLTDWRAGLGHVRPVLAMNATIAESGDPFVASPADFPYRCDDPGIEPDIARLYCHDMAVAAAARLSATFPYITPIARPADGADRALHLADGGYYDNFGIATSVEYLDRVLEVDAGRPVLLVEIRAYPDARLEPRGAFSLKDALTGPLETMLAVRGTRRAINDRLICGLEHRFAEVPIARAIFVQSDASKPLSWHLTEAERAGMRADLQRGAIASELDTVRACVTPPYDCRQSTSICSR